VIDGVRVDAYRTGDQLCIEGSRGEYRAFLLDDDIEPGPGCATRGVDQRFSAAGRADEHDALMNDLLQRVEVIEQKSSVDGTPDLGLLHADPADLRLCSAVTDAWDHLDDARAREALYLLVRDSDTQMQLDPYYFEGFADATHPSTDTFSYGLLLAETACWRGGFVGPDGEMPPLPPLWTEPLTQEAFDADQARAEAAQADDPAAVALSEELYVQEEAQIEAAIAAHL
jgi:hypothetical protein